MNEKILDELWEKEQKQSGLKTECHILKNWLENNFVSGKYFSIEEIIQQVRYADGTPLFKLNTNPKIHDKCIKLSKMVKDLNWATNRERYIPIIKDKKGGIKLCETEQELKDFIKSETDKVEKAWQYANHLKSLISVDGSVPIINLANRSLSLNEMKPVDVYKKDTHQNADQSNKGEYQWIV